MLKLYGQYHSRAYRVAWLCKESGIPYEHINIHEIAAFSLALAGSLDQARSCAAAARRTAPRYSLAEFLTTFTFDPEGEALFREGAKRIGMA